MPYKDPIKRKKWQLNKYHSLTELEKKKKFKKAYIQRNIKRKEIQLDISKIKNRSSCFLCGWKDVPDILQYHHKDKKTKKFNIVKSSFGSYSWETIKKEIEKCILLCPNCHFKLHYQEHHMAKQP